MKAVVWHDVGKIFVDDVPNPTSVWTRQETIPDALQAYAAFGRRDAGWTKVTLEVPRSPWK
jgi:hypothetical protein